MSHTVPRRTGVAIAIAILVAGVVLGGGVFAAAPPVGNHDQHHPTATPATGNSTMDDNMSGGMMGGGMMSGQGMGMPMPGLSEIVYLDMMIRHAESGLTMADAVATTAERDDVRALATKMAAEYQTDIAQLRSWRSEWYPGVADTMTGMMSSMMGGMMSQMMGNSGDMSGMQPSSTMGAVGIDGMMHMMDPQWMVDRLGESAGPIDMPFIQMMVAHHQMAVMMSRFAPSTMHAELRGYIAERATGWQDELGAMQRMLTGEATPVASTTNDVTVTLTEFVITSSRTEFKANETYHFVVTNNGVVNHEFMIMPVTAGIGQMDMDMLDDMAIVMIPVSSLPPGATQTVEVTFTESMVGPLEIVCAAPGHYDAGMKLPITVMA